MATKLMYAVLDKAANLYMAPFFVIAEGLAVRDFVDEANNPSSLLAKHAKDFSLYRLGSFDDATGSFFLHAEPQYVLSAVNAQMMREDSQPQLPLQELNS